VSESLSFQKQNTQTQPHTRTRVLEISLYIFECCALDLSLCMFMGFGNGALRCALETLWRYACASLWVLVTEHCGALEICLCIFMGVGNGALHCTLERCLCIFMCFGNGALRRVPGGEAIVGVPTVSWTPLRFDIRVAVV
jgi:hypothetical protein